MPLLSIGPPWLTGVLGSAHPGLRVHEGECVWLEGVGNLVARSLFAGLAREVPVHTGMVTIMGRDACLLRPHDLPGLGVRAMSGWLRIFPSLSVEEHLRLIVVDTRTSWALAQSWFPWLPPSATTLAGNMSGGQQQGLALAMVALARPALMILEEPYLGLSPEARDSAQAVLKGLLNGGAGLLAISGDDAGEPANRLLGTTTWRPPDGLRAWLTGDVPIPSTRKGGRA